MEHRLYHPLQVAGQDALRPFHGLRSRHNDLPDLLDGDARIRFRRRVVPVEALSVT